MSPDPIPIAQPTLPTAKEVLPHLEAILESGMVTNFSTYAQRFERTCQDYLGAEQARAVASGDLGLVLALKALDLPAGSEVIVPSYTFASTANAIRWNGLEPVFADIQPDTLTIDPGRIEEAITEETAAILGVHTFGNPCDVDAIDALADDLPVVYDAAHAYGASYDGRKVGTLGDIEVFSFSGTKLVTSGEGGLVATRHASIDERLEHLRGYGFLDDYNVRWVGLNAKLSELEAMLGCLTIGEIDDHIHRRAELVAAYRERLEPLGLAFQSTTLGATHAYKDIAILCEDRRERDALAEHLADERIQTKPYFLPIHQMDAYRAYADATLPVTEDVAARVLCLPLFSDMTNHQTDRVCDAIEAALT